MSVYTGTMDENTVCFSSALSYSYLFTGNNCYSSCKWNKYKGQLIEILAATRDATKGN